MTRISTYQLRKWQRRTTTILLKAQDLQSALLSALGDEDPLTDHCDNVISYAQDMADSIDRRIAREPRP